MPEHAVLFVCLGNICRSPLAKVVFAHQARERGVLERFTIDSCGTGHWHAGGPADPRTISCAIRHGIPFAHTARQFDARVDVDGFDLIVAMDRENVRALAMMGAPERKIRLFRSFDGTIPADARPGEIDVPDPYLGGPEGFERVYEMVDRASAGLLDHFLERKG